MNHSMTDMPDSPAMQAAWQRYWSGVEQVRQLLYGHPYARGTDNQLRIHNLVHQLQAVAYMTVIAPRPDYPTLEANAFYAPPVFTWVGANPDFLYSSGWLDGRRTYRLWGKRGNARMLTFQSTSAFYSDPESMRMLGSYDYDAVAHGQDGSFEFLVSAIKPTHGNWIKLDADSRFNWLLVREAFYDWERETPSELNIEVVDDLPKTPMLLSESEFISRMDRAVSLMKYCVTEVGFVLTETALKKAGANRFYTRLGAPPKPAQGAATGAAQPAAASESFPERMATVPDGVYSFLAYDISSDQAIVIEGFPPQAKYWSIQLNDQFNQGLDYVHHRCTINGHQVKLDGDGKFRLVLAARDPGVPNWLDTVGTFQGFALMRIFYPKQFEIPSTKLVDLADLRTHLPGDTPFVSASERTDEMRRHKKGALRRYYRY